MLNPDWMSNAEYSVDVAIGKGLKLASMIADIAENLGRVLAGIRETEGRCGRAPDSVQLIAVSKTHPPEAVQAAADAGQTIFGESKVQEAKMKVPALPGRLRWHLIGHLQSNKARTAISLFELIHGVDSLDLLEDLERLAKELGVFPQVLLQVNLAGESSKHGFAPRSLLSAVDRIARLERVQIRGLMTIPPLSPAPERSRPHYVQLRELRNRLESDFQFPLPELSMGMSNDYLVAIEEGSTMVRVGTAIFGERPKRQAASNDG